MLACFVITLSYSQDTLELDKKVKYYSSTDTIRILDHQMKNIHYRADYARELLKFPEDSFRLEYCFYYDNKRYVHYYDQLSYVLLYDSVLNVTYRTLSETWIYRKINDTTYFLKRSYHGTYESGYARKLVPLEKKGKYVTMNNVNDTLWTTEYIDNYYPNTKPYHKTIDNPVYSINDVDTKPEYIASDDALRSAVLENIPPLKNQF